LVRAVTHDELQALRDRLGSERIERGRFGLAAELLLEMMTSDQYTDWLTTAAYRYLD